MSESEPSDTTDTGNFGADDAESDAEPEADPETVEIARSELEELRRERDEFADKYRRRVADLQNLRKRKQKERQDYMKYAHEDMARDLLEVIDNFDRALETMEIENEDVREGVRMILNQLNDLMDRYDVEPIESDGQQFDPHFHEGMMREEREDLDEATVLETFKTGYTLHDRVLRPASVKVGVPAESDGTDDSEEPEASTQSPSTE